MDLPIAARGWQSVNGAGLMVRSNLSKTAGAGWGAISVPA